MSTPPHIPQEPRRRQQTPRPNEKVEFGGHQWNWSDFEEDDFSVIAPPEAPGRTGLGAAGKKAKDYGLTDSGDRVHPPPSAKTLTQPKIEYADREEKTLRINDLLRIMLDNKGSDLHLTAGAPPKVRIDGEIQDIPGNFPTLTGKQIDATITAIMTEKQRNYFEKELELDFSYELPGESRFRVNVMQQRTNTGVVMRTIPNEILPIESLNMPLVLNRFADLPRGLVLVTGPTGSGKSTTLAAIIDKAKRTRQDHIMTIEDPIEFVHEHGRSIVNQREVGTDTHTFADALRHVLRQDPDIIMIGEMRDPETTSIALTAAETGHLVFGTLHTQSAKDTINRIIDMFPDGSQNQIQAQLAASLQAIVCQNLLKKSSGKGRVAAVEVMVTNSAIKNNIRKGKLEQITSTMITHKHEGMQTMDSHLVELITKGVITPEAGLQKAQDYDYVVNELGGREGIERIRRNNQYSLHRQNG
mgnify:CR=1 FL=1